MILTDRQIQEAVQAGEVAIEPFDVGQVQPASIDLRVGEEGATTKSKKKTNIKDTGFITLEPGDFGVIAVFEEIRLSAQHAGRIGLRSKYTHRDHRPTAPVIIADSRSELRTLRLTPSQSRTRTTSSRLNCTA